MPEIPNFRPNGKLPPGLHVATLDQVRQRFGNSLPRRDMLEGLNTAIKHLSEVGCKRIWLDGSFVTDKKVPGDYDCCYDTANLNIELLRKLHPVLADPRAKEMQKKIYLGEFYPASLGSNFGVTMLDFFQLARRIPGDLIPPNKMQKQKELEKLLKEKKGIIEIKIGGLL